MEFSLKVLQDTITDRFGYIIMMMSAQKLSKFFKNNNQEKELNLDLL